jgi:hypothetical protein
MNKKLLLFGLVFLLLVSCVSAYSIDEFNRPDSSSVGNSVFGTAWTEKNPTYIVTEIESNTLHTEQTS